MALKGEHTLDRLLVYIGQTVGITHLSFNHSGLVGTPLSPSIAVGSRGAHKPESGSRSSEGKAAIPAKSPPTAGDRLGGNSC